MSRKNSIKYLFPPEKVSDLPTWRFVLHFKTPILFSQLALNRAISQLEQVDLKAVRFSSDLKDVRINPHTKTVPIPIQVPESRRHQPNSLADYESDVWKIWGTMIPFGFGELYYEAVDWQDQADMNEK